MGNTKGRAHTAGLSMSVAFLSPNCWSVHLILARKRRRLPRGGVRGLGNFCVEPSHNPRYLSVQATAVVFIQTVDGGIRPRGEKDAGERWCVPSSVGTSSFQKCPCSLEFRAFPAAVLTIELQPKWRTRCPPERSQGVECTQRVVCTQLVEFT